jgi:hypothetical protein
MKQIFERVQTGLFFAAILIVILVIRDQRTKIEKYKYSEGMLQGGDITKQQYIDSLQHVVDSLYWELLPTQIELGRYQVAYGMFKERNPKAAKQFDEIISSETE